jgi:radical SAM superfamily enzyme YgiQ (UPF0313 family)
VLKLMRKPPFKLYRRFEKIFYRKVEAAGKNYYLLPYFISSFPGAALDDAFELARYVLGRMGYLQQIQDFTPIPLSDAACMYHVETDLDGKKLYVAKKKEDKLMQRALLQHRQVAYGRHARKALVLLNKSMKDLYRP